MAEDEEEKNVALTEEEEVEEETEETEEEEEPPLDERTSFTADSPYFSGFAEMELKNVSLLGESLEVIAEKSRTLAQTGIMMSEATRSLALSCRLRSDLPRDASNEDFNAEEEKVSKRKEAIGEDMANLLEILGDVSIVV
jgi:hypothetical protein